MPLPCVPLAALLLPYTNCNDEGKSVKQQGGSKIQILHILVMHVSAAGRLHACMADTTMIQSQGLTGSAATPLNTSTRHDVQPLASGTSFRKRPRNHESASTPGYVDHENLQKTQSDQALHVAKRSRAAEWPSQDAGDIARSCEKSAKHRKSSSARHKNRTAKSIRPSKFLEGSMNDKTSRKPPSLYTDEEAVEGHSESQGADMDPMDITCDAGIEPTKTSGTSGVFRFGKAIANAFRPGNVWQGINGIWKEKEEHTSPEKNILQERQAKAAVAYAELKKSGFRGTQNAPINRTSQVVPKINVDEIENDSHNSFRDSGVDVDGYRSSSDQKESDRKSSDQAAPFNDGLVTPTPISLPGRSASPFSDANSGRRSSLRIRKPSFQSIKRVTSQIQLPSVKQHSAISLTGGSANPDNTLQRVNEVESLRKQPSKKDIAKQYKLNKRVSDLENKLEIARRELELSLHDAPPVPYLPAHAGRKNFVPGALSSLPSERNLNPQDQAEDLTSKRASEQLINGINDRASLDLGSGIKKTGKSLSFSQRELKMKKYASADAIRKPSSNRCKTNNDNAFQPVAESKAVVGGEAAKRSAAKTVEGRAILITTGARTSQMRRPSKTPTNSPTRNSEEVPPVPAAFSLFDPTKVDQTKILKMRSDPNGNAPFGKIAEDVTNLRKEFPDIAEGQLHDYVGNLPDPTKDTIYTSVQHPNRPASPFLGPPQHTSPMKTRSKTRKRGISPPPPSLASAKKTRVEPDVDKSAMEDVLSEVPAKEEQQSLVTKTPLKIYGKPATRRKSLDSKLSPDVQKENVEWPDYVF